MIAVPRPLLESWQFLQPIAQLVVFSARLLRRVKRFLTCVAESGLIQLILLTLLYGYIFEVGKVAGPFFTYELP